MTTDADRIPRWPVPPGACVECARHASDRFEAQVARDRARVAGINALIMRHHPGLRRRAAAGTTPSGLLRESLRAAAGPSG